MPRLDEVLVILTLLKEEYPQAKAWVSFSCKDKTHTNGGDLISDCARALESNQQVYAVGVNCTAPEHVTSLIKELKLHTEHRIIVYPNSGEVYDEVTKTWHGSSQQFLSLAKEWKEAGATMIGGCCRTTPEHISALHDCLNLK